MLPFQAVAEGIFYLVSGTNELYESPFNCALEIYLLTYLLSLL